MQELSLDVAISGLVAMSLRAHAQCPVVRVGVLHSISPTFFNKFLSLCFHKIVGERQF